MDGTTRVYWVAALLPDGRAVVGMLAVLEPRPPAVEVVELNATPARSTLRGARVIEAELERSAA